MVQRIGAALDHRGVKHEALVKFQSVLLELLSKIVHRMWLKNALFEGVIALTH